MANAVGATSSVSAAVSIPLALPGDKARTSAILIPPGGDPGAMSRIAARVVTLGDLRGLAAWRS